MCGGIPPLPQYVMAWCLVKHRTTLPLPFLELKMNFYLQYTSSS